MILLSSHRHKQWGQLGEILGGVKTRGAVWPTADSEAASPGGVVSNTGNYVSIIKNDRSGRGCIFAPSVTVSGDKMNKDAMVYRGEIYFADLDPVEGSEQGGRRPVLIIQNDIGNRYAPTTIISPITSQAKKYKYPTHVHIKNIEGIDNSSIVMLEQIRTISKDRLEFKMGKLNQRMMQKVNMAIHISLGIGDERV